MERKVYFIIKGCFQSEEDVHYAMLQSESPGNVFVISGPIRSCLPEIMKYPVNKITYIERDPALVKSVIQIDLIPGKLSIENTDAYTYIRNTPEKADVILLLLPPPSTLLLNKYYTTEFFNEVKKRLNVKGIFMCSPGPGDTYFNKESLNLYSSIFNSMATAFKNIKPVIGNKIYFIASDKDLTLSFCKLTEIRNIKNTYVSSDYLSDDLIKKKSDEFSKLLDHGVKQNRFAFPVASFHFQTYNFSKNTGEKIPSIIFLILLFALPVFTIKRKNLVMYFSASALAGFEIIMLLTLQLLLGNMFQLTGLVIAGLMTGLAIGAGTSMAFISSYSFLKRILFLVLFYLGFGLLYNYLVEVKSALPAILLILLLVFIPALYTGHIFRELTLRTDDNLSTSETYSADLAGSALGFILISGIMIPVFGIQISIFILSLLVFIGFLFGAIRNKL
jgi:spermidine synthase